MIILSIKFNSALPAERVRALMRERSEQFRTLNGLLQKYYTQDASTGEWCGIYLWDSIAALEAFRASELAHSIAAAYQVIGTPRVEILEVHLILRENLQARSS
jgi:quinol monooxygenase YgiN